MYKKKRITCHIYNDGDDDNSCDIIFDNIDNQGKRIFYIIQSKRNNINNCTKEISTKDIKQSLNDFEAILRGKLETSNQRLRTKLTPNICIKKFIKMIFLIVWQCSKIFS